MKKGSLVLPVFLLITILILFLLFSEAIFSGKIIESFDGVYGDAKEKSACLEDCFNEKCDRENYTCVKDMLDICGEKCDVKLEEPPRALEK